MKTPTSLVHERIDDVPLLIGLAQKLRLSELLDHHLGRDGNHRGLSIGALAAGWIAFILSRSNHTKVHVQEWSQSLHHTLSHLETVASFLEFFRPRTGLMQGLRGLCAIGRLLIPLHVQGDTLANVFSRPH